MPPVRRSARLSGRNPVRQENSIQRRNVASPVSLVNPDVITTDSNRPPPHLERPDSPEVEILYTQHCAENATFHRPMPALAREVPYAEQHITESGGITGLIEFIRQRVRFYAAEERRMLENMPDYIARRLYEIRTEQIQAQNEPSASTSSSSTNFPSRPPSLRPFERKLTIAELAVSREIADYFGPNGLKEKQNNEMTEIEEMVFQTVLRRKLVCGICMTHMKMYICSKCLYSMCQECTNIITGESPGGLKCPHCRRRQKRFEQIKLPRL